MACIIKRHRSISYIFILQVRTFHTFSYGSIWHHWAQYLAQVTACMTLSGDTLPILLTSAPLTATYYLAYLPIFLREPHFINSGFFFIIY